MASLGSYHKIKQLTQQQADLDELQKRMYRLRRLHQEKRLLGRWVFDTYPAQGKPKSITLKPIFVDDIVPGMFFARGRRVIAMSATILSPKTVAKALGIPMSRVAYIKADSDFPAENRPIYLYPVGNMNRKYQDQALPRVMQAIERILEKYPNDRGIIHSHSRELTNKILEGLGHHKRLLFQEKGESRSEFLERHRQSKNGIIVTPGMYLGLDLKDDLSRVQVILKMPWPNLGDRQVRERKNKDPEWYIWMCAVALVQAYGRSVRSKKDWAHTYVLDEAWYAFEREARSILPQSFLDAVIDKSDELDSFLEGTEPQEDEDGELSVGSLKALIGGHK
jgi:Rad3-related DNA helicase